MRKVSSVYVTMGLLSAAWQMLDNTDWHLFLLEHLPVITFPFLLLIVTGFWATKVGALHYGVLGGAVMGLATSFMSQDEQFVTFLINGTIFGAILALLGGLPVWFRRFVTWGWPWIILCLLPLYTFPGLMIRGLYFTSSPGVEYSMKRMTLTGRVMNAFDVFELATPSGFANGSLETYGKVLVVGDQVYPFIENPRNVRLLRAVRYGEPVEVEAEIIPDGHLIQILSLTKTDSAYADLDSIRNRQATRISITGTNLCQCGMGLGTIQSNCSLGHFHHLATPDKLYSYLLDEEGQVPFTGKGYHYHKVRVTGVLYGDFFLKVSDIVSL